MTIKIENIDFISAVSAKKRKNELIKARIK